MKLLVEKTDYRVFRRRDGKYCVKSKQGSPINGKQKVDILTKEGLIHKNNGSNGLG